MKIFTLIIFGVIAISLGSNEIRFPEFDSYESYEYESYESEEIDLRISGGTPVDDATLKDFKYQVGMLSYNIDRNTTICGGVIVHPEFILTAAHCVYNTIKLGIFKGTRIRPRSIDDIDNIIIYRDRIIIHENYVIRKTFQEDDIAIIKLQAYLQLNKYVGTIRIASVNSNCEYGTCWISGWGRTSNDKNSIPDVMNYLEMSAVPPEPCIAKYGKHFVPKKQICSYGYGKSGVCQGDSGGPYVFIDFDNQRVLCGLNSFGTTLCVVNGPRVHTAVLYYRKWICAKTEGIVGC